MIEQIYTNQTFFGKTRKVFTTIHNAQLPGDTEHVLWVERPEDEYALLSPQYKGKKVAVVRREHWLGATII